MHSAPSPCKAYTGMHTPWTPTCSRHTDGPHVTLAPQLDLPLHTSACWVGILLTTSCVVPEWCLTTGPAGMGLCSWPGARRGPRGRDLDFHAPPLRKTEMGTDTPRLTPREMPLFQTQMEDRQTQIDAHLHSCLTQLPTPSGEDPGLRQGLGPH